MTWTITPRVKGSTLHLNYKVGGVAADSPRKWRRPSIGYSGSR
jgi:hypothetical protein